MNESFLNGRVTLHCGDCLDVLATLPENSIDSCCTDPPYGLQFMGREWDKLWRNETDADAAYIERTNGELTSRARKLPDYKATNPQQMQEWHTAWVRQVYRVLKPGAHLLAFGGTRTYHRMACAIEDAGFEIRDTILYLYGAGFPKSHSIGKKLDESSSRCTCISMCDLRQNGSSPAIASQKGDEDLLQRQLSEQDICRSDKAICEEWIGQKMSSKGPQGRAQSSMERRRDLSESPRQLRERKIRPMPAESKGNGEAGRLRDGTSPSNGYVDWPSADANGMCASQRPQTVEQSADQSGIVAVQSQPQVSGTWPTCGRCGKPIVPDGYGTALKPACEPIVLARKPLSERTVAANVLKWGTGAINVDGCRVETSESLNGGGYDPDGKSQKDLADATSYATKVMQREFVQPQGRWPANVITDGSEEVVGAFPETGLSSGGCGEASFGGGLGDAVYGKYAKDRNGQNAGGLGDAGSAARYFYTSKADANDRLGSKHPTVKPLDLMQYLVRLITSKGGTVLDPFAGTGTTGEAAWREGMNAVLIEREPEYQVDIRRRMELCLSGPDERQRQSIKAKLKDKPADHGPLFAGVA